MSAHIGDDAALYALGILEPDERRAVEEHLATCEACRRLFAQAEADVTAIAAAQPQHVPRRAPRLSPQQPVWNARALAFAAAIVVALVPSGYLLRENLAMHDAMQQNSAAISRVMSTPHRTTAFAGADAHVMYGKDGSWYVVIVRGATAPLHVMWPHDGTSTMIGTAMPYGNVAVLYLPQSHPMQQLMLMQDGHIVGQAQLVF
jgi:anti-sigma factor RsiW